MEGYDLVKEYRRVQQKLRAKMGYNGDLFYVLKKEDWTTMHECLPCSFCSRKNNYIYHTCVMKQPDEDVTSKLSYFWVQAGIELLSRFCCYFHKSKSNLIELPIVSSIYNEKGLQIYTIWILWNSFMSYIQWIPEEVIKDLTKLIPNNYFGVK
jgi:hypothetical protein